jgi:hypothetical protein
MAPFLHFISERHLVLVCSKVDKSVYVDKGAHDVGGKCPRRLILSKWYVPSRPSKSYGNLSVT